MKLPPPPEYAGAIRLAATWFCIIVLTCLLHACGQESPTAPARNTQVQSVSVSIGVPDSRLVAGGTQTVYAAAVLASGEYQTCTATASWTSSNPSVAAFTSPATLTGLTPGTVVVSATCSGVVGVATVTVYPSASLSGTVRDQGGTPVAGAAVSVANGKSSRSTVSDSSGRYSIAGLAGGTQYSAYVAKDGYESNDSVSVTVNSPETGQDFTLRVGISVSGRVSEAGVGPLDGAIVEVVSGVNAGQKSMPTDSNGTYVLQHLLPGQFTLRVSKTGYDTVEQALTLTASASQNFTLKASYGSCLLSVAPLSVESFPSAGGETTVAVEAGSSRSWTAATDQPWAELLTGANATGPAVVRLRLQPAVPGATDNRTATLRVGCSAVEGQNVRISQLPDCGTSVIWAADSPTSFTTAGGAGHVLVSTGTAGCHWQAVSQIDWIQPVGVRDWYGDLDVGAYFVVKPNTTGAPRVGSIVFGEKAWEVRQAGQ